MIKIIVMNIAIVNARYIGIIPIVYDNRLYELLTKERHKVVLHLLLYADRVKVCFSQFCSGSTRFEL